MYDEEWHCQGEEGFAMRTTRVCADCSMLTKIEPEEHQTRTVNFFPPVLLIIRIVIILAAAIGIPFLIKREINRPEISWEQAKGSNSIL